MRSLSSSGTCREVARERASWPNEPVTSSLEVRAGTKWLLCPSPQKGLKAELHYYWEPIGLSKAFAWHYTKPIVYLLLSQYRESRSLVENVDVRALHVR